MYKYKNVIINAYQRKSFIHQQTIIIPLIMAYKKNL